MPISDFRKKKLLYVFNVFFDVNQSGTIDRKDFELAIERICSLRGWSSGSVQYKKTFDSMIVIWEGLKQRADSNKDGSCNASVEDDIDPDYEPQVSTLMANISPGLKHILDTTSDGEQHITLEKEDEKGVDEGKEKNLAGQNADLVLSNEPDNR
ncbi:hypothetical protein JTB14_007394 [Gonioctena quinquepunctata]|nr:hypothetical protein JTB14_007394 [Gonioctena quinquepunctata]